MSKLVIVESPTKARTIEKFLGKGFVVKASMGHIRDLPSARLCVDIKNDFSPKYEIVKGKEKLVRELKKLAEQGEEVYLATDPDREGEAISWHLAYALGLDPAKTKRVKFNEINRSGVAAGMAAPSTIDNDMVNAQQARRILDRLVGYTLSPFISQKIRRGLSAGRVQSVAVRLIVDREEEIEAFIPEEYWSITAKLKAGTRVFKAQLVSDENGKVKMTCKDDADRYFVRLDGADYRVMSVKKGKKTISPAPPFTTSTLQQDASRKLGFSPQRTMRVAQELFEGVNVPGIGAVGLITYMRTDSLRISDESRAAGNKYIAERFGASYLPEKPRFFKQSGRIQDGHEAIRPTQPELAPENVKGALTPDQFRLYSLIWKRFIASLMANCVHDTKKVEIEAVKPGVEGFCVLAASGHVVRFDGFTAVYDTTADDEKENELPELKDGAPLKLSELIPEQHFTQPPARYTEASLIKTLEETGVGRPSTYATIISTITKREYVVKEKKQLKPTELGTEVTKLLKKEFPKIVNTKFTAGMETELDEVEAGELDYIVMLREFWEDYDANLRRAKADMSGVKITLESDVTDVICEKCGRNMVIKQGRYGKFLACPGYPECSNAKPYVEKTPGVCPKCGGEIIGKFSRKGSHFFSCSNWPRCDFSTWDTPTDKICPDCGSTLFSARGRGLRCLKDGCGHTETPSRRRKKSAEDEPDNE